MATKVKVQSSMATMGSYAHSKSIEAVQREYGVTDVIKLASNENTLGTSPRVLTALADLSALNYYPDPKSADLASAIAARAQIPPDWIMIGNGADALIHTLTRAFLDDDDEIVIGQSTFPSYELSAKSMRARVIKTAMPDHRLDLRAMAGAIASRTKIVFVCNPNNPTGTTVSADEVDAFLAKVPDDVLVVFDQAYQEYADAGLFADGVAYCRDGRENVMVLRTFSKAYGMAGLRLGYAIAHPSLIAPLYAAGERFGVNRLAQAAGLAALEDDEFLHTTVEIVQSGRNFLYSQFDRLGLGYVPSQTNFVMVHFGPQAWQIIEALLRRGVILRPGTGYGMPEHARITVGTPAENQRLVSALAMSLDKLGIRPAAPAQQATAS